MWVDVVEIGGKSIGVASVARSGPFEVDVGDEAHASEMRVASDINFLHLRICLCDTASRHAQDERSLTMQCEATVMARWPALMASMAFTQTLSD